jgi:hypothetical protein
MNERSCSSHGRELKNIIKGIQEAKVNIETITNGIRKLAADGRASAQQQLQKSKQR